MKKVRTEKVTRRFEWTMAGEEIRRAGRPRFAIQKFDRTGARPHAVTYQEIGACRLRCLRIEREDVDRMSDKPF